MSSVCLFLLELIRGAFGRQRLFVVKRLCISMTLFVILFDPISALAQEEAQELQSSESVPGVFELFTEIGEDFKQVVSRRHIQLFAVGGGVTLLGYLHDKSMKETGSQGLVEEKFELGSELGSTPFQVGGSLATYVIGRLMKKSPVAHVGADLLQAQMIGGLLTHALKHSVRRTRPNGHKLSFPSGHTSAAFASAAVLERHFGWKIGVPVYALSAYVAASRVQERKHYLSDVLFGATIGIVAGRSVSVGHSWKGLEVLPVLKPGGGGVMFVSRAR